jgi:hypothetical protein
MTSFLHFNFNHEKSFVEVIFSVNHINDQDLFEKELIVRIAIILTTGSIVKSQKYNGSCLVGIDSPESKDGIFCLISDEQNMVLNCLQMSSPKSTFRNKIYTI